MKYFIFVLLFAITTILTAEENLVMEIFEEEKGESGEMVKIPNKDYKIDVTEVTNKEYEKCVNAGKCEKQHYTDGKCYFWNGSKWAYENVTSEFKEDKKPVVCVDFQQAKSYCEWVGKRLPTEEEWEYAAKGGENYEYAGSDNLDEVAWYDKNSGMKTHEVATKKANGYGLYDMSGNAWEWTNSWYYPSKKDRVLRGGVFFLHAKPAQVDFRFFFNPVRIYFTNGFRCAQSYKMQSILWEPRRLKR